jgi:hypothetical protein
VPAVAEDVAAVSSRTFVSELDPSFWARIPWKSVRELMSLETLERRVPRFEIAESCPSRDVNWFFQGVSTFERLLTISATVELTLNPVPLVGDPKLSPTVPIE